MELFLIIIIGSQCTVIILTIIIDYQISVNSQH